VHPKDSIPQSALGMRHDNAFKQGLHTLQSNLQILLLAVGGNVFGKGFNEDTDSKPFSDSSRIVLGLFILQRSLALELEVDY